MSTLINNFITYFKIMQEENAAYNPRFIVQTYSLHHRWKVPWATPSFLAAALPLISPRRQAAMTGS